MTRRGDWWPVLDAATFAVPRGLDVLLPSRGRPVELAATLAGLAGQQGPEPFGVLVGDRSDGPPPWSHPAVASLVRVLAHRGHPVRLTCHPTGRGPADHRAALLSGSRARFVLQLDDDIWLEPDTVDRLLRAIYCLGCGFVGNAPQGLSFFGDVREDEQVYEEWQGLPRPEPEEVTVDGPAAARPALHAGADVAHLTARLGLDPGDWRAYRVAPLGSCVLYDRAKLIAAGGFDGGRGLPAEHTEAGVRAQLGVRARDGGAGVLPSGAYDLESDPTVPATAIRSHPQPRTERVR